MRPRSFSEEEVIQNLRTAFRRHGYEGLSLDVLSEATGLNRSSLYNAFGSKRGMMRAAVDAYCRDSVERCASQMNRRPVSEGARAFLGMAAGLGGESQRLGCLIGNLVAELASGDEADRAYFAEKLSDIETALCEGLRRAQQDGAIAQDADVAALAQYLMITAQGLRLVSQAHPSPEKLARSVDLALETFNRRAGVAA